MFGFLLKIFVLGALLYFVARTLGAVPKSHENNEGRDRTDNDNKMLDMTQCPVCGVYFVQGQKRTSCGKKECPYS